MGNNGYSTSLSSHAVIFDFLGVILSSVFINHKHRNCFGMTRKEDIYFECSNYEYAWNYKFHIRK